MASLQTIAALAFIISFVCFLIFAIVKGNREEMEKVSREMGFTYIPKATINLPDLELFGKGHLKKIRNLFTATRNGLKWSIFDYQFSSTWNAQYQTVVMAQLDRELPEFSLSRKHFYHKLGKIAGSKEIVFEDYPEFSREYCLKGQDETAIRQLFTSHVILTMTSQQFGQHIEAKGNFIILYIPNIHFRPKDLHILFQRALIIINLFREFDDLSKNEDWRTYLPF